MAGRARARAFRCGLAAAGLLVALSVGLPVGGAAGGAGNGAAAVPRYGTKGLWITDAQGRDLFLRGVDVTGAEDTPTEDPLPYGPADFKTMRADGVTVVRLPIAWANIEPTEGHYDEAAIARAVQIVDWAGAAGLRVVLDMHQYEWADCFGGNGMPRWTVPDCPATPPANVAQTEADDLIAENAFWHSPTLQSDFAQAWVQVARALRHPYFLMGYDILNEPGPGLIPNEIFEQDYLAPFYRQVGSALRAVDPGALLFVEPSILNGIVNGSSQFLGPIGLPRLVYEPHQYGLDSFNADAAVGVADVAGPAQFAPDLAIDLTVARRMDAAVWLGEWGAINPAVSVRPTNYVEDDLSEQDQFLLGSDYWSYDSSLRGPDTAIGAQLTRLTPDAIAGTPTSIATGTQSMTMSWQSDGGQTLVSFPASCRPVTTIVRGMARTQVLPGGYVSLVAQAGTAVSVRVACL
jgi:endoglycosylceramidase